MPVILDPSFSQDSSDYTRHGVDIWDDAIRRTANPHTANLRTNIMDVRGFDSSICLNLRGGIPRPKGDFPESLTQAMLVGCNVSREIGRTKNPRHEASGARNRPV